MPRVGLADAQLCALRGGIYVTLHVVVALSGSIISKREC